MLMLPAALFSNAAGANLVTADPQGTIGIRILEAPVSRREDPRALSYIVDHLHPGVTIQRKLEISNTSGRAQHISLYPAGADIVRNTFSAPPGQARNELARWISLDRTSIDVAPGGKETAQVTIKVPPDASRGERYGVVWAETVAESDTTNPVRVVHRVGIRVYLDVGSGGEAPSDFQIENLTPRREPDGSPQLAALVRNTGKRALDMSGTLSLSEGPSGLQAGPFPADLGVTLLPGSTAPVTVTLDRQVPNGPWKVRLTLMSGLVKRAITATVTFPATGTGPPVTPDQDYLPMAGLIAGLVVLPATALGFVMRRRRRSAAPAS